MMMIEEKQIIHPQGFNKKTMMMYNMML